MTIKSGLGHSQQSGEFIPVIIVSRLNNPCLGLNTHLFSLSVTYIYFMSFLTKECVQLEKQ